MNAEEQSRLRGVLDAHVGRLLEHFDSIRVFASVRAGDISITFTNGGGAWETQRGQVHEWVLYHDEQMREKARQDMRDDD
jgi:hypothetical protein